MGLVMERAEGRRKGMRIRELEDEVKKLKNCYRASTMPRRSFLTFGSLTTA